MRPSPPHLTKLQHIHLTTQIPYTTSLHLQDQLLNLHWKHRSLLKTSTPQQQSHSHNPPPPFLLSFSTHPTYTVGRRHLQTNPLSAVQIAYLTSPSSSSGELEAEFYASPRGGLLTFHGPGQLTAYPIVDLRRYGISARCYVRLLEDTVAGTCNEIFEEGGVRGKVRAGRSEEDPGVWILERDFGEDGQRQGKNVQESGTGTGTNACSVGAASITPAGYNLTTRKICALGVQVTRGVTAHGVGLNVRDEPITANVEASPVSQDEPGYLSHYFTRITACGLEGKSTTWLAQELATHSSRPSTSTVPSPQDVATRLARHIGAGINRMSSAKGGKQKEELLGIQSVVLHDEKGVAEFMEGIDSDKVLEQG